MRVISGNFKGKKIQQPKDDKTRPLKDLAKESIFNIIKHSKKINFDLTDAHVLDLFSGVGSFGIECLSRGARKVIFIENYSKVLPILKKNLEDLKLFKNFEVINKDIYKDDLFEIFKYKFNIIFLDPPYRDKNLDILFEKIINLDIIEKNGIVILHRHKSEKDIFPPKFKIIEKREYGISKIIFLIFIQ